MKYLGVSTLMLLICAGLAGPVKAEGRPESHADAAPPDILVVLTDQWRGDCLSAVGHPAVKTPNADQLATEGVLFRRGYATVPSCIPAKYAFLTGQSPQASGVVGYKAKRIGTPTLPEVLSQAGYATVLVGRNMHLTPPNPSVGFAQEILGSTYVNNDAYDRYLREVAPLSGGILAVIRKSPASLNGWGAAPWPLNDEWHPTAWVSRQSEQVVANAPAEKPLFLTASYYAPHPPLLPPKKLFDAYHQADLPKPARGDWVDWSKLTPKGSISGSRVLLEGEALRKAQAGYYGLIEHIDREIAPLIAAFKARSEQAGRPWVIVFTSDHGEMMGDHGYFRKCEPYEGSANIPFIVAGSKNLRFAPGTRPTQPVALEDLMPTFLSLAGAETPAEADGINLLPVLRDPSQPVREILHLEHAPAYSQEQGFHCLTDGRMKYIWRPTNGAEHLFDLVRDPDEEHDLSPTVDDTLVAWRERLIQRLSDRPEGFVDGGKLVSGRPYAPIMKPR